MWLCGIFSIILALHEANKKCKDIQLKSLSRKKNEKRNACRWFLQTGLV